MIVVASTVEPLERRAPAIDRVVRWAVAAALMLLLVAAADPFIARMAESGARVTGVVPRLFAFFCIALQILILIGRSSSRPSSAELLFAFVSTGFFALALVPSAVAVRGESELAVFNALRATAQSLCAVSAGLLLARQLKTAGELLALLACLVAVDVWINSKFVPDKAALDHPLTLLRQPWPPLHVRLIPAPALPEILALSALVGAAARLQLPLAAMLIGVASGYCAATFFGLASQPVWPKMSVLMITTGSLIACWPELEIGVRDLVRAMLLAFSLMVVLSLFSYIKQSREIPPKPRTDLLNRLKRAEGQLRGVQRMIEEGQPCADIANQMAAVRKALDSTHVRLSVCYLQQELQGSLQLGAEASGTLTGLLEEMQTLLGRGR